MGFFDPYIVELDIADERGVAVKDTQSPFASLVVNHVAIGKPNVRDWFPEFGSDAQSVGNLIPKHTVVDPDVLSRALALVGFDHHQVIQGSQETIRDLYIAAVANINAVGIGSVSE